MFLSRGDRDLGAAFQTHPGRQAFTSSGSKEPRPPELPPAWRLETADRSGVWEACAIVGTAGFRRFVASRETFQFVASNGPGRWGWGWLGRPWLVDGCQSADEAMADAEAN